MKITAAGIDLAKSVFHVHGVDERAYTVLRKQLKREQLSVYMDTLSPCQVGMEACDGAHHWAYKFEGFGDTVRLMSPQFVKPYVKSNKNDAVDAEAICEAVSSLKMRFVPRPNPEAPRQLLQPPPATPPTQPPETPPAAAQTAP